MTKKEMPSIVNKIVNYFGIEKSMMVVLIPTSLAALSEIAIIIAIPNKPIAEECSSAITKSTKKENA